MIAIKKCAICGKEFEAYSNVAKYCSPDCKRTGQQRAQNKRRNKGRAQYERVCPVCRKEFVTLVKSKMYCSSACKTKVAMQARQEKKKAKPSKAYESPEVRSKRIIDINKEAQRRGMTYGQYKAELHKEEMRKTVWNFGGASDD